MEIVYVYPSEIEVGKDRLRKDLGDTEDLEKSIRKLGLLQPIGITKNKKLVWGWRRLETWKKVKGDKPIPAIVFPEELSKIAELIENVCRVDLPWHLKDTAIAELHKKFEGEAIKGERETEEEIQKEKISPDTKEKPSEEFLPSSGKKSRGRPPKEWTQEDTAEVLGLSQQKVSTALSLVEAIKKHPELKKAETEREAIRMLKKMESKESEEEEKEKTWKCDACGKEYGELDGAPRRYIICRDCLADFESWRTKKVLGMI